jgi:electron transport complex protein RnfA
MTLHEITQIAFNAFLVENVILYQVWGTCSFFGVSTKKSSAIGMGGSVMVVLLFTTLFSWLIYRYCLIPLKIEYLQTLVFILVIATFVQALEMFFKKFLPKLHQSLGIYLPLITTNCCILGVANASVTYSLSKMMIYSLFSGFGFLFVIVLFSYLRYRLTKVDTIPKSFVGFPLAIITASALALIFSRLGGIF